MEFLLELDDPMFSALHQLMDIPEEVEKTFNAPTRAYVRDRKAMRNTPADVKDLPNALIITVDMPGVKQGDIKVQIEDGNVLVISGERKRSADEEEKEKEGKYLRMERRMGKFMRRFPLPENVKSDGITAAYKDGVLNVTVEKLLEVGQSGPTTFTSKPETSFPTVNLGPLD